MTGRVALQARGQVTVAFRRQGAVAAEGLNTLGYLNILKKYGQRGKSEFSFSCIFYFMFRIQSFFRFLFLLKVF